MISMHDVKMADPTVTMVSGEGVPTLARNPPAGVEGAGGKSPLEFEKLYQHLKKISKIPLSY